MTANLIAGARDVLDSLRAERWLVVGAAMTTVSGIAAFALIPVTGMVNSPTLGVGLLWLILTAVVVGCHVIVGTIKMARSGDERPLAILWSRLKSKQTLFVAVGTLLLAENLLFFCIIKPQLGQLVAFTADPLLADIDYYLFGADPWLLIEWFKHPGMELIYHRGWFLWLAFVAVYLLSLPSSREKDRLLISYMMLWSIFGPLVHLMLPAAGPVFFDELGFGDRFTGLRQSDSSQTVATYLWTGYSGKIFYPAGGISAMPSLHLTTMFWSLIAIRNTRWLAFGIAFTTYIFLGSIAIGWHYAVDGLAGAVGALVCYWAAGAFADGKLGLASILPAKRIAPA